jgi:SAM-dependent methyltransferase
MSADRLGIDSVDFFELDLLNVEALGKKYDVVESMGVLHHMSDPEEGVRALLKVIKSGGYLKLGLYSELARRNIVQLRDLYLESGMKATDENIRAIRKKVIESSNARDGFAVMNRFIDFYSMSACRDLIFHEQEHRFTVPQIKSLLDKYNLKFLGFYALKRTVINEFNSQFGEENLCDLDSWAQFEEKKPDTFVAMYQFLTQVSE